MKSIVGAGERIQTMEFEAFLLFALFGAAVVGVAVVLRFVADPLLTEINDLAEVGEEGKAKRLIDEWLSASDLRKNGAKIGLLSGYFLDRKARKLRELRSRMDA
jgi:hypothetical protein